MSENKEKKNAVVEETPEVKAEPAKKEKAPKEKKTCKGLSDIALKWTYFGVALVVTILVGVLGALKAIKGLTIYGNSVSVTTLPSFIDDMISYFGSSHIEAPTAINLIFTAFFAAYNVAMLIVLIVFFIMMLVNTIILACKKYDRDELDTKFRKIEKEAVKPFAFFLMFDCFLVVAGGVPSVLFVMEIVVLAVMLFANAAVKYIRDRSHEEKPSTGNLVYACIEAVIVFVALFAIFFGLTREPFFFNTIYEKIMFAANGGFSHGGPDASFYLVLVAGVLKTVGFFLALSIIRRVVAYYPYDDRKNVEDAEGYAVGGFFGKSIAALVLYVAANVVLYVADAYTSVGDILTKGVLILVAVLGVAITLRIAASINKKNNKKDDEEEEEEAEVEEEPAPAK